MCGLLAIWGGDGDLVPAVLDPLDHLLHRGPDGTGRWVSPCGRAALGHARLATVDPEGGAQPIHNEDRSVSVVATGELYDDRAIARRLRGRGHRFGSASDSEILVHLYEERGIGCLDELRGEFAFVLWDARTARLLAVRDRFGVKPLFYARLGPRRWVFASEVKAILAAGHPGRWDRRSTLAFVDGAVSGATTLFEGIHQVPPGGHVSLDGSGPRRGRYWEPCYPRRAAGPPDLPWEHHVDRVRGALEGAVASRLRADVAVGCHLSGGLDSSSVATLAAGHGPMSTHAVRFHGEADSEAEVARRTAEAIGTRHHEIEVSARDYVAHVDHTIRAGEMLQENGHGTARLLQARSIRAAGCTVVLTGDGGDELFGGYPQTRRDIELSLDADQLARHVGSLRTLADGAPRFLRGLLDRLGFVPSWLVQRHAEVGLPVRWLLRDDRRDEHDGTDWLRPVLDDVGDGFDDRAPAHQGMRLFLATWFPSYLLAVERLDLAHAVESRVPLLDHDLFETATAVPLALLGHDGPAKPVLRAAVADRLPAEVLAGPKRPFLAPPLGLDRHVLATVRARVAAGGLEANGAFDSQRVVDFLDRAAEVPPRDHRSADRVVQIVNSICVLQEAFDLGEAR